MAGIKNLDKLLKKMNPSLSPEEYVFCTIDEGKLDPHQLNPLLIFREKEGITLIVEKHIAEANNLSYSGPWSMITLNVHSDLEAVGFLAKITSALAAAGISVNVVSAYYHDHLFVPSPLALKALEIIKGLSEV